MHLAVRLVAIACISHGVAFAQTVDAIDALPPRVTVTPIQPYVGAARHHVPLVVPPFKGLEPKLAIAYSSSASNGWLGIGMRLEGLSTIERVSATLGAPRGDSSDVYLLDGEQLIPCVAGSVSPSCTTGGTHATRRESHRRVVASGATWTVTSPTGEVSTYQTFAAPIAVLVSRVDTSGNTVTYSYATDSGTTYLSSIAYNGTTITLYRAARSDEIVTGSGSTLRRMRQRLVSIAIRTGGVLDRAYALSFGATGSAGLSQLTSVREFGADATVSGTGAVSGGTALPPTVFAYNAEPTFVSPWYSGQITTPTGSKINYARNYVADVNGDGRGDAIALSAMTSGGSTVTGQADVLVRLGRSDGTFTASTVRTTYTANGWIGDHDQVSVGDVNGDGRADLVMIRADSTYPCCSAPTGFVDVQVALGTATGGFDFRPKQTISTDGYSEEYEEFRLADVDGDGDADVVLVRLDAQGSGVYGDATALVALWNGTSFATAAKRSLGNLGTNSWGSVRVHTGDVNGDHRDDIVVVTRGAMLCSTGGSPDRAFARASLATSAGAFATPVVTQLTSACSDWYSGDYLLDVTGDGLADLVGDVAQTVYGGICSDCDGDLAIVVNTSNGNGSFATQVSSIGWSGSGVEIGRFVGTFADVNGDRLPDRVGVRTQSGDLYILVSYGVGDGTFERGTASLRATSAPTWWTNSGTMMVGDIDGDGRYAPVAMFSDNNEWHILTIPPSVPASLLAASATVPTGGRIEFAYTTSTSFTNGYLPFAFPVLASSRLVDGRGGAELTTYSYTGGLYSKAEHRFLGFATARSTDATGAYREQSFTQHVADPDGTVASTHERTSGNALMRYSTTTFARSGNGTTQPYLSQPTRAYVFACNGDTVCKSSSKGWTYSAYGAIAREIEYGDDAVTGDERTTFRTQVVNPTKFITHLDSRVTMRAGAGVTTGTLLGETVLAYDSNAGGVAPSRGLVTYMGRWRDPIYTKVITVYDAAGNVIETQSVAGNVKYTYDARSRLVTTTNALGHVESRTYDTLGRTTSITNANGGVTTLGYDPLGRLVSRTTPDGAVATASFTSWGNPAAQYVTTTVSDGTADGLWTRTYLDGLARTVRVLEEGGITTDTRYDTRGLESQVSAPYAAGGTPVWTTTTYDAIGRVTRVTLPDTAATTTTYGDWTTTVTNPRGRITDTRVDAYGQVVEVTERATPNQVTRIGYDLVGNRVSVTDALGNVTTHGYDLLGRRTSSSDPDLGAWLYGYDDADRLTSQRDARGVLIRMSYDAIGRPLRKTSGIPQNPTIVADFTYDQVVAGASNIGRLTRFTDASGATQRSYDAMGRIKSEDKTIAGVSYRLDWTYDSAGRLASVRYPALRGQPRELVTVAYDAAGRTTGIGAFVTGATYDARRNLTAATYGNGATLARTYSATRGWLMSQTVSAASTVRDQFTLTRDLVGNVTARTSSTAAQDAWLFTYDPFDRLTVADNTASNTLDESFTYNAIGNRTQVTRGGVAQAYTYPAAGAARPHAPTAIAGQAVRYDANGNRLGIGAASNAVYDATNKLVDDGTTYLYDAEGTRVRAGTKTFLRDLVEIDGATATSFYYLDNQRVARRDGAGAVAYYHFDSLGTVRSMTSASGAVLGTKRTSAFGEILASTGATDPFGIAGQRLDASGLYHMGARVMDARNGQFTQPDPSADANPERPQTLNRYTYAYNNPLRIIDPSGFQGQDEDDPLGIRILRHTENGFEWQLADRSTVLSAPELYTRKFFDQPSLNGERGRVAWAFESQTGKLFGDADAYSGMAFDSHTEATQYIDSVRDDFDNVATPRAEPPIPYNRQSFRLRIDLRSPQYLESDDGGFFRYDYNGPGRPGTLVPIGVDDVPSGIGYDYDQMLLFIFREMLTS